MKAIKLHPFDASAKGKRGMEAEGVQFYCLSSTYSAIVLLVLYFIAIFDTSAEWSEAYVLKGCIKNCSIVKLYNKVLIITDVL